MSGPSESLVIQAVFFLIGWRKRPSDKPLENIILSLGRRVNHILRIKPVIPQLIHHYLISRKIFRHIRMSGHHLINPEQQISLAEIIPVSPVRQMPYRTHSENHLPPFRNHSLQQFPEVEFEFVLATNSTDYYRFRQDHDDMPDILTVRRFALKDAVLLKDYLYDLSNTELTNTYYGS